MVALCREQKPAAAKDERAESRVALGCAPVDQRQQPLCPAKIACREQSLDSGRARQLGEVPVELLETVEDLRSVPPARGCVVVGKLEYRECDPQAKRLPSVPARLDDTQQLGDRASCLLRFTPIGVDLGEDRQTERLEHVEPDLARELDRFVAQLRGRIPGAGGHLDLRAVEQAPDDVRVGPFRRLRGQGSPESARLVVPVGAAEQESERDARR